MIHKREGIIRTIEADLDWIQTRHGFSTCWRRMAAVLDPISDTSIDDGSWTADLGDWVHLDGPVIGFCSNRPGSLLLPDRGFHGTAGYRMERRRASAAPAFDDRDPAIVWRGSPSGPGDCKAEPFVPDNPALLQRTRMCLLLRGAIAGGVAIDAKIIGNRRLSQAAVSAHAGAGILGTPIPQPSWCHRRFAIDIDGWANAFSNFFIRLIYGCCVIKVASPLGYRQWYYDRLEPWRHYVPAAADLSDLRETIAWCLAHPRRCREIAAAGQRAAWSMTPQTERDFSLTVLRAAQAADDHGPTSIPLVRSRGDVGRRLDRRAA